ncbi:hypothetical protein DM860_005667 [Cuscuta australis]|uniref:Methyltransferase type 11 domain-containing protein n=1 Tax=Cuscuta australis TaxID=267555 RepID=A0A328DVY2_9ASTE|nr:hypothetical protein DM860_005667 [Cuscuta australis]
MGKKGQKEKQHEELLKTLGDFTSKENWDSFFTIRGSDDAFEWYSEWPQLQEHLLPHISVDSLVLVPGCGNSNLSEHLYDAGCRNITNIDFSKVVISDMLRKNVRSRPEMKWRVMDMTSMLFANESFDVIVDKGGLDALMEPRLGPKLGNEYLSEVKRVLKAGGKFFCLTLAEAHVLDVLFHKLRHGWKMSVHAIAQKPSKRSSLQTYMVIAEKDNSCVLSQIFSPIDHSSVCSSSPGNQADGLLQALKTENRIREAYSNCTDKIYSLEELKLGAQGDITELSPGRRLQLTLGEPGISSFSYKAALLDVREELGPFSYHCGVFLVPKARAHEWLFSTEEGQWVLVENSKAARLIIILLDCSHTLASMDDIQSDLSPLVKQLAPINCDVSQIPFMAASDGIKERKIVHEVTSPLTGPITVDDVIYEHTEENITHLFSSANIIFRRLTFQRTQSLVQSEAVLTREASQTNRPGKDQKKSPRSKSKKKGHTNSEGLRIEWKVDHRYLASSYHTGIISGLMLISSYLKSVSSKKDMVKTIVIGLGAGLLPMFLHMHMPFLEVEVVELEPVVLDLARDHFDFIEDGNLKVHITDGLKFVKEAASSVTSSSREDHLPKSVVPLSNGNSLSHAESINTSPIDILIVDVDSSDSSSGLSCPAADFVEESFLAAVKESLSEQGLFIVNLVSRSPAIKEMVSSRMKSIFKAIFHLELEEDVNEVVFALKSESSISEEGFPGACDQLLKLMGMEESEFGRPIIDVSKKIKRMQ